MTQSQNNQVIKMTHLNKVISIDLFARIFNVFKLKEAYASDFVSYSKKTWLEGSNGVTCILK